MKFMDENFLLHGETAKTLYQKITDLPVIDYHCHLDPKEIAENKRFQNLTELWLGGDHYKWRLMRANGIGEKYITGDAPDYEKFEKWCETIEDCIGSPLYHWTHLELKRYFDCDLILSKKTAQKVWAHCNSRINENSFDVLHILKKFKVEVICTTDDPADSLEHHLKIKDMGLHCKVLPTFRPSKALAIEDNDFCEYIRKLSGISGISIKNYEDIVNALYARIDFFGSVGCKLSDHSLEPPVYAESSQEERNGIVQKALAGQTLLAQEINRYKTGLLVDLGRKYAAMGWVMQLHMSALRNNNTQMLYAIGPDTGFDSISDEPFAFALSRLLDALAKEGQLPKTILYSLNPVANDMLAAMAGNFQTSASGAKSKVQYGAAWWYNDTKTGMRKQMTTLANLGMLSGFIGMLTDSRSFLSYTRHEYFRRIMANLIAEWVENGEFPEDHEKLEEIVRRIAYDNAKKYFEF